jgi:hypothetical protein
MARQGGASPVPHSLSLRPRLTAIAPSAAEVVWFAGGWLFDQVMAGWDVTVITDEHGDSRPLRILGVRARDLDTLLAAPLAGPCLRVIALRTDLYEADERVRRLVQTVVAGGRADIRLWGSRWPADFCAPSTSVSHQLSLAAMAFKAHALAAADVPVSAGAAAEEELFQRCSSGSFVREGTIG